MLDNAIEFLTLSGRSLPHAAMMLIPEPWDRDPQWPIRNVPSMNIIAV